uniref:Uncharacterized protein n=1 Tax=uncultured marine virus TaxID=186617 RepID=A0A0F7L999_9VIRU|nr:hypothetical protein [uncultured marine virus]
MTGAGSEPEPLPHPLARARVPVGASHLLHSRPLVGVHPDAAGPLVVNGRASSWASLRQRLSCASALGARQDAVVLVVALDAGAMGHPTSCRARVAALTNRATARRLALSPPSTISLMASLTMAFGVIGLEPSALAARKWRRAVQ